MQLCDKCGNLMLPIKEKGKSVLYCRKCKSRTELDNIQCKVSEKIEKNPLDGIPVIEEKIVTLPKIDVICPECGHAEAVWWTVQTRSSDEPETRFFRCLKCSFTWREYS